MTVLLPPDAPDSPILLHADFLVGRGRTCDLVLDDPLCSSFHAAFSWTSGAWHVRDLGSRNGTWVNGLRLPDNTPVQLETGTVVAFGNPPLQYVFEDRGPPRAGVVDPDGSFHVADHGLLALPSETDPLWTLVEMDPTRWRLEDRDGASRLAADGETLDIGGRPWVLRLPAGHAATRELRVRRPLDDALLRFYVSMDEEHVLIEALCGGVTVTLPDRSPNYLLLLLARRRIRDVEAGVCEDDAGWLHREQVASMLKKSHSEINVWIFRLRKLFHQHDIEGAARIIERRTPDGLLRIGVARIEARRSEAWPPNIEGTP